MAAADPGKYSIVFIAQTKINLRFTSSDDKLAYAYF